MSQRKLKIVNKDATLILENILFMLQRLGIKSVKTGEDRHLMFRINYVRRLEKCMDEAKIELLDRLEL